MSSFWALGDVSEPLARLADDLATGAWEARYGHLRERTEIDAGYRLVTTPMRYARGSGRRRGVDAKTMA